CRKPGSDSGKHQHHGRCDLFRLFAATLQPGVAWIVCRAGAVAFGGWSLRHDCLLRKPAYARNGFEGCTGCNPSKPAWLDCERRAGLGRSRCGTWDLPCATLRASHAELVVQSEHVGSDHLYWRRHTANRGCGHSIISAGQKSSIYRSDGGVASGVETKAFEAAFESFFSIP